MPTSLQICRPVFDAIVAHAGHDYPDECCGILLGRTSGPHSFVDRVVRAENIVDGDRGKSYQIDWRTLFSTVRSTRQSPEQEQIVGFYHSHPDGSTDPSPRDSEAAWEAYSYVIVSMPNGRSEERRVGKEWRSRWSPHH